MLTQRDKNILPGGRDHETAMRLLNEPGAVLQWRHAGLQWNDYEPVYGPHFLAHLEWRIKPKTLRYRVAIFKDHSMSVVVDEEDHACFMRHRLFRQWSTPDWQEVEV